MEVTEVRREVTKIDLKSIVIFIIIFSLFGLALSSYLEYDQIVTAYNNNVDYKLDYLRSELLQYSEPLLLTNQSVLVKKIRDDIGTTTDGTKLNYDFTDLKAIYSYTGKEAPVSTEARIYLAIAYYDIALENREKVVCQSFYRFLMNRVCENNRYI